MASTDDSLAAAVAAGVLPSEGAYRELLSSIVETARAIFAAQASSIFLFDEETDELVFEAISGVGSELVGTRFPSGTGIAGWVLMARQAIVLEDVAKDPRFAREVAESTGYVPSGLMAAPLLVEERTLGVLEVLDRPSQSRFTLGELDLLGLFANQAAIALDLLQHARRARRMLEGDDQGLGRIAGLAASLDALEGEARVAGSALVDALATLLDEARRVERA
jgi:GAF domain-containing protein